MNISQLNQLPITDFLCKIGIEPSYKRGESQWYVSPIREPEQSPSFKVNTAINRWYDYALMQGGKLFDLAERLYPNQHASSLVEKLNSLFLFEQQNQDFSLAAKPIWPSVTDNRVNAPAITINEIKPLGNNPAITSYLESRGIPLNIARSYCKEVYYQLEERQYFAAGFENRSGGYELRNAYFKGASSPKDITHIGNEGKSICVVEGFMDFLSLLTLQKNVHPMRSDFLVLNSVSLADRSLAILEGYQNVFLYLDHDNAGRKTQEKYQSAGLKTVDASVIYKQYKDLNDYLVSQKSGQKEVKQRQEYKKSQGLGL
ncbi:toprim domain-containing protein [Dyadobacter pollutisoli]|uniref:Toprim domain-containing protein n=1 Tax=Dyadobacter pollutisoli TaxID=2910158 RepID=A0A9E8NER6_9BACT|nr:toprim domain-containing protein [Dyadobacter pollutisoli]WAC12972.1 toprim domain-containing protein [Dyadobacter pollutisoli]